jgi:hypothetical protein
MNFKTGLAVAAVVIGLGASSVAMERGRASDDERGRFRRSAWHDEHDRKGYDEGKKKGWKGGSLPPGQERKESKQWRHEHEREAHEHHRETSRRQREAWEHRHHGHEATLHKQPKFPVNAQKKTEHERMEAAKQANKEHRAEVQHR